jgi:subtilisin family serine protease
LLLSLLTGFAFGAVFALIMQRAWFATLDSHTRGRGADLFAGGLTAAVTLLIMASALSFNGGQLMLMLALPPLGWLAVALAYGDGGYDWRPPALFVGLAAFAMLAMMETNPLALVAADPALGWIAAAAALTALFGLGMLAAVLFLRRSWGTPGRPMPAALAAVALWLMAGLFYVAGGQPGFHGDRLFVILKDQAHVSAAVQMTDYDARRQFVYGTLVDHADRTQADLRQALTRFGIRYRPYYLVNAVEVEGGLLARALLSTRADVDRILPSPRLRPLPTTPAIARGEASLPSDHGWNLSMIGADRVWQAFDVRGDGIVIGASDSGVQADHPELAASYRGRNSGSNYNWFDPWSGTAEPIDYGGHGTHTTATVTGGSVGVAPSAEWIACANLQRNLGNPALYLDCLQFMLAPFPLGGEPFEDGDPTRGAHVLNNSWGCPASDEGCDPGSLGPAVDALAAAGVFVVASAGNAGPGCSSLEDPIAIYDSAFTVGAVDALGNLAYFSSVGPVTTDGSGRTKPDITAPGVAVWSAFPGGTFSESDGTSMAGPHVAGVVALMWSANPALIGDIERTEAILRRSAQPFSGKMVDAAAMFMEAMEEEMPAATEGTDTTLNTLAAMQNQLDQGGSCIAQSNPAQTPNNLVGYGIVDAYAAVAAARAAQP